MIIPDDRLDDFIDRYERAYGERLSRENARPIATRVLDVYRLILQPLPAEPHPDSILARTQKEVPRRRYRPRA